MNILFVMENYLPHIGGAELVFKQLAEELVKKGHTVNLVTHRLKDTKTFEIMNGVNVYRVRCLDSRYLFTFFSIPKVLNLAKKADIIHTTTFNGAFPAWFAAKLRRKPIIITVHEVWVGKWQKVAEMGWLSAKMHSLLERMIYWLNYSHYCCVSKATQKDLLALKIPEEKTSVVYNAVDYNHFDPKKHKSMKKELGLEKNFVFIVYGRPGVSKGIEYVVKAANNIINKIPKAKLLLILSKDPQYSKRYQMIVKLIDESGVSDKIIVHDPVAWKDLPSYIKSADCIIIPSIAEGFGFAAAETCAMDIPIVVTSAGSLPEVVSGKQLIIQPKSPEQIAEAVIKIHDHKYNKTEKKQFLLEDNTSNYLKTYDKVKN